MLIRNENCSGRAATDLRNEYIPVTLRRDYTNDYIFLECCQKRCWKEQLGDFSPGELGSHMRPNNLIN